jgi:hypothetical protein
MKTIGHGLGYDSIVLRLKRCDYGSDVISIVEKWKAAVIGLDDLIYSDQKKNSPSHSKTVLALTVNPGWAMDFELRKGAFDKNPFVIATLKHIEEKRALGDELIERIKNIQ